VVAAAESHLLAVDELSIADLAGEVVIVPSDDVLGPIDLPGTTPAAFAPLPTVDAIVTAASGVGIVIVPMSLARLHHRKDAGHRPLLDGPTSTVALVWPRERTTPDVETFVGIVRGRTSNSSR
jgi:DNA-binding transcriptional LysR family regulator